MKKAFQFLLKSLPYIAFFCSGFALYTSIGTCKRIDARKGLHTMSTESIMTLYEMGYVMGAMNVQSSNGYYDECKWEMDSMQILNDIK